MDEHTQTEKPKNKSSIVKKVIGPLIALAIVAGGAYWIIFSGTVDINNFSLKGSEKYVATVNGEHIEKRLFDARLTQSKANYEAQGVVFEKEQNTQLQEQVLNNMIDERLLVQHAQEQGIEAENQQIEEQYQLIVSQFGGEQELTVQLEAQNATVEDVKNEIADQLVIQQLADRQAVENNIEVSAEEVQQTYDDTVESGAEVPPLQEVEQEIRDYLRQQKVNQLLGDLAIQLRMEGSIEVHKKSLL